MDSYTIQHQNAKNKTGSLGSHDSYRVRIIQIQYLDTDPNIKRNTMRMDDDTLRRDLYISFYIASLNIINNFIINVKTIAVYLSVMLLIQIIIVWGRRCIEETRMSQPTCDRDKIEYNMRRSRKVRQDVL